MEFNHVVKLVHFISTQDDIGQFVNEKHTREVYCNLRSVGSREFFEAGRNGLSAELTITMFAFDYKGEEEVEIDGKNYGVYRTYNANVDTIELYLERKEGYASEGTR